MELAIVLGQLRSTVKDQSLVGRKLTIVQAVTPQGEPRGHVEVALDVTSAAPGSLVLLTRGSAARIPGENRQLAVDLSIVAIVDEVTIQASAAQEASLTTGRSIPDTATKATTRKASSRSGGK